MIPLIFELAKSKEDLVIVGSAVLVYHDFVGEFQDLDIVVTSLDGLENFGQIITSSNEKFRTIRHPDKIIDVYLCNELVDYVVSGRGVKYISLRGLCNHYSQAINDKEMWFSDSTRIKKFGSYLKMFEEHGIRC